MINLNFIDSCCLEKGQGRAGQDTGGHWVMQEGGQGCHGDPDGGSGDGRKGPNSDTLHSMEAKLSV